MQERNPWKTLKIEERYSTPWISVSHHDVIDPSGAEGIYGVVHFKNLAVGIVRLGLTVGRSRRVAENANDRRSKAHSVNFGKK